MSSISSKGRRNAILWALLVTLLWASSWILIKVGLDGSLPPLTFAGLRYSLAFLMLLPLVLVNPTQRRAVAALPKVTWRRLALLGLLLYAVTQGAQFVALSLLPAATLTLLLTLTPVVVALLSILHGDEAATAGQWGGTLLSMVGAGIYFFPLALPQGQALGLAVGALSLLTNSVAALMGRQINRDGRLSPLLITTISMGIGGLLLLAVGVATQGLGEISARQWAIILWLAVANTAFAFTVWNRTMQTLTAVESSIIANLMLPQIAIMAWVFLGEALTGRQIAGLVLVGVGTLVVQLRRGRARARAGDVTPVQAEAD